MTDRTEPGSFRATWDRLVAEADQLDRAVYLAVAGTPTPTLDGPVSRLSDLANYSRLWIGVAGGLALVGGRSGRRSAAWGLVSVGATSAIANLGVKSAFRRRRPDRADNPERTTVRMPTSTSFPSGHTASAFAFAFGASETLPWLALPLVPLAAGVGYSRVHTGVHYPGDVLAGAVLGSVVGSMVPLVLARPLRRFGL
jgi:membrane-associated phospholipid phosphatase